MEELYAYTDALRSEEKYKSQFHKRTFHRDPMVDVLSTSLNIRNLGIVDSSMVLCCSHVALHQGVLRMVEEAHRGQRSSRAEVMEVRPQGAWQRDFL